MVLAVSAAASGLAAAADCAGSSCVLRDCELCPALRIVPAGEFYMGSHEAEPGRSDDEGPHHRVKIPRAFALGVYEVTRGEFARFVAATGYDMGDECSDFTSGEWALKKGVSWRNPGFNQSSRDPVVCVSWVDAQAFVSWLSCTTGKKYRLPSEAEWEYAARAGQAPEHVTHDQANFGIEERCCGPKIEGRDRWAYTAPVGSFPADSLGIHDLQGNVWEWLEDCYQESYDGAPADGSARTVSCSLADRRAVRGGGWGDAASFLRPAYRLRAQLEARYFTLGFRVARSLD
jgi:formylglycine-generating enzyme required for sulfatase activity